MSATPSPISISTKSPKQGHTMDIILLQEENYPQAKKYTLRADDLIREGRFIAAEMILLRGIYRYSKDSRLLFQLGKLYRTRNRITEAVEPLEHGAALAPHSTYINYELGLVRMALRDYEGSLSCLNKVRARDAEFLPAATAMADVLMLMNKLGDAHTLIQGIIAAFPDREEARRSLARFHFVHYDFESCLNILDRMSEGQAGTNLEIGLTETALHQPEYAVDAIETALEIQPFDLRTRRARKAVQIGLEDPVRGAAIARSLMLPSLIAA